MSAGISDDRRGLYNKYEVRRRDGSSRPGGKHERCSYFVLDLDHDPNSMAALVAYTNKCEQNYPQLARDLRNILRERGFPRERRHGG